MRPIKSSMYDDVLFCVASSLFFFLNLEPQLFFSICTTHSPRSLGPGVVSTKVPPNFLTGLSEAGRV